MRGGNREGSGRPAGTRNVATAELKRSLSQLAREYTDDAFFTLLEVAQLGESERARVAAATAILDRGYGRPATAQNIRESSDLPPIVIYRADRPVT